MAMFIMESSSTAGSSSTSAGDSPLSWSPGPNVQPGVGVGLASIFTLSGMPMGAGEGHIGNLITQRVLERMDTDVMWRTLPGPRDGGVVLINASSFNGAPRALRANGKYQRWNTGVSLQYFDRFNARFSSMMEWEVQVIPTRVQRPPFQVGGAARLCGLQSRGSGEIQVGVSVADHDGNFDIPGAEIMLVSGRSLIELGSALEERFGSSFRFRNMSIFIRAGNLGQPFPLLTDLPSGLDDFEVVVFMFGTPDYYVLCLNFMMEWAIQVIPTRVQRPLFQLGRAARLSGPRRQVGIGMADYNGNFNGPCEVNLLFAGRSLIELGNALEDRFGDGYSFQNIYLCIRPDNLGQPFPLLTDLPREIDNIDDITLMVGTPGREKFDLRCIQFFVRISGFIISMYKDENATVGAVVKEALSRRNMRMFDSYIEYNHKIIIDDNVTLLQTGIRNNCHININPRLRGGNSPIVVPPGAVPLKKYVQQEGYNKNEMLTRWFVERKVPDRLVETECDIDDRAFFCNTSAQKFGVMLTQALENEHRQNRCFGGFKEDDVYYDPLKQILIIAVPTVGFTSGRYIKDWNGCKTILNKYFCLRTPTGKSVHAMMVNDLVKRIDKLKEKDNPGLIWRDRAILYAHPCFKTAAELIGIILKIVLHAKTLEGEELDKFMSAFAKVLPWIKKGCQSRRLKKMINYKVYNQWGELELHKKYKEESGFSRLDMSRCALEHVVRAGKISEMDVFVLLCILWEDQLPYVMDSMLRYRPPDNMPKDPDKSKNHLKVIEILGFREEGTNLQMG